jgi:diguanylate cyclase (GGDEF)-like protein
VSELTPPIPVIPVTVIDREKKKEDRPFPSPYTKTGEKKAAGEQGFTGRSGEDFFDVASVMGIDEEHLTPEVRRAISGLMYEVDNLRLKLSQAQEREAYLTELADRDSISPILNRRAFNREIARLLNRSWPEGIHHSLVYLDFTNADRIKAEHGHMALEGALIHLSLLLKTELRETDVLGSLGGNDFGVILTVSSVPGAAEKAAHLKQSVAIRPFAWVGKLIALEVACGTHVLLRGDTPEIALQAADQASRN